MIDDLSQQNRLRVKSMVTYGDFSLERMERAVLKVRAWPARFSPPLAARLQELLDNPEG